MQLGEKQYMSNPWARCSPNVGSPQNGLIQGE